VQLLNALHVTLPDSHLRLDNDTVRLLVGDQTRLRVPLGLVPLVQARLLARHLRGEAAEYPPFAMR